eukprot:TRINITY_DN100898_c0_g1_i1.p1 TRINITY_DN100898_c0_g1~~TRINITY_DN100898_c0_g1_i1.p1  ORF type:complete len:195 (+),score=63.33 TRINITY_DN100898_c0_g1_i1:510-1094(+)
MNHTLAPKESNTSDEPPPTKKATKGLLRAMAEQMFGKGRGGKGQKKYPKKEESYDDEDESDETQKKKRKKTAKTYRNKKKTRRCSTTSSSSSLPPRKKTGGKKMANDKKHKKKVETFEDEEEGGDNMPGSSQLPFRKTKKDKVDVQKICGEALKMLGPGRRSCRLSRTLRTSRSSSPRSQKPQVCRTLTMPAER